MTQNAKLQKEDEDFIEKLLKSEANGIIEDLSLK